MKKILIISCFLVLVMGCSNEKETALEIIKVANLTNRPIDYTKIYDEKEINKINEILNSLKWVDKAIETNGDPDYSFWLERKGVELRITNYEIWFNEDNSVIVDHIKFKYALIKGDNLKELKNSLESSALN